MNQDLQTLLNFIQQSEKLSADEKNKLSSTAKNIEKELELKNRDLGFEKSLEKVRAVALTMKKADELTEICEVLFTELRSLGFSEMRNTMINIHNDDKGSFLNYDYSDEIGKSITHFFYNTHPVIENQVKQIRSSKDAFSVTAFRGSELVEWKKFRKSRGEKDDPRLENISELIYYFYSIGKGSIGISSFGSLHPEKLEILKRFRNVFDLAYQRYMDVAQAEAQAREAQIELALERVRAATMAMQNSDELEVTASLLFQQVKALGVQTGSCGFNIWEKEKRTATVWMSSKEGGLQAPFKLPHTESLHLQHIYSAMQNGEELLVEEVSGDALKKHFNYLMNLPIIGDIINKYVEGDIPFPASIIYHTAFFKHGYLSFHTDEPCPEVWEIFKRFSKVFEQSYTRFLDLLKAEAQTKEAKIELALERVRSRTMAMQKSDELKDVIQVVYEQFVHLNFLIEHAGFIIDYKVRDDMNIWLADQHEVPSQVTIPYFDSAHWNSFNEAKEKGMDFFANNLTFEEKNRFYQKLFKLIPGLTEETKEYYFSCPGVAISTVLLENVGLYIQNFSGISFSDEENATLMRFGKVFQQTYTRFLDLQKVEGQAREAQIEAALEKVRGRAMAMHNSNDLSATASIVFSELRKLGIHPIRSGVGLLTKDSQKVLLYAATTSLESDALALVGQIDMSGNFCLKMQYESCLKKENYFPVLSGEELKSYYKELAVQISVPSLTEEQFRHEHYGYYFPFSEGYFYAWTEKSFSETEINILNRFKIIVDLTFRRYLDLQKAEAQAREANIEVSLERVRARSLAMHKSDELVEASTVLFNELKSLNIETIRTGIGIVDELNETVEVWSSQLINKKQNNILGTVPFNIHPFFKGYFESWKRKEPYFFYDMVGEEIIEYYKTVSHLLSYPEKKEFNSEESFYIFFFPEGSLNVITQLKLSEDECSLMIRFARVFGLIYRRFLDLKQAEAQAKEALVEVALERVRSRTMAMHKSDELAETAAILFKQLSELGIAPNRLYIFIINDETGNFEAWITEEDGKKVSQRFKANIRQSPVFGKMYNGWKEQNKSITIDLKGKELTDYINFLSEELHAPVTIGHSQKRRVQSIAYFSQGCIGIASPEPQPDDTINLLERFAGVFNLTYTRFNDLQNAEAQTYKANIEVALERVRARALAMQQPEELKEVAQVLRSEMGLLGVEELETCSIYIKDESAHKAECWYALKDLHASEKKLVSDHFALDLNDTWVGREMLQFYNSSSNQIAIEMKGVNRKEWFKHCEDLSIPLRGYYGEEIPDRTYHLYKFSNGAIGAASAGDISEESKDLLKRTASVFSLAYSRYKDLSKARIDLKELKEEKKKSDALLLNILPAEIADELKKFGKSYARKHEQVTILFADIKGFSSIAENLSAEELVAQLDECFRAFDNIVEKHGLEKIKTIGDAYVAACGLPKPVQDNAPKTVLAALDMIEFIKGFGMTKKIQNLPVFEFRVGIHTGPVITGVVGLKKFTYDIWGDAVNMAARMEQHGEAGKINVSGFTFQLIKDKFNCIHRGKIEAKNKGEVDMYFVEKVL